MLFTVKHRNVGIVDYYFPGIIEYNSLLYSFDVDGNNRLVTGEQKKQQTSMAIKSMEFFRPIANGVPLALMILSSQSVKFTPRQFTITITA